MIWLLAFLLGHVVFVLAFVGWARTGWRVFALVGLPLDVLYNFTTVSVLLWSLPMDGEWTISKRLKRQRFDVGWRGARAHRFAELVNRISPGHI